MMCLREQRGEGLIRYGVERLAEGVKVGTVKQ